MENIFEKESGNSSESKENITQTLRRDLFYIVNYLFNNLIGPIPINYRYINAIPCGKNFGN